MKKVISIILCIICLFSIGGCSSFSIDKESEIYSKTVQELLNALDNKDVNTIYNLFSVSVQKDCEELKEKIEEFVLVYNSATERIGDISSLAEGASYEHGGACKNAYTTFPVLSDGKYYWIYLDLMYENTFDENQIGITQLDFFTADAYYDFCLSEANQDTDIGLHIFNKEVDNYNVISINNYPYNYHPTENLNIEEVKSFLKTSTSLTDFEKKFGRAAASDEFGFMYSLSNQDGENRYLYLACQGDKIIYSDILSNFSYIDTILEE